MEQVISLKKVLIVLCVVAVLTGAAIYVQLYRPETHALSYAAIQKPPEWSQEELYKDMFVTAVHPHIARAVAEYYGRPLMYGLESVDILSVTRPHGYRTFEFEIKLQVKPFVGAHNTIGIDNITVRVESGGIEVEKFEHIQGFEPPAHLKNLESTR